ncbi:activator of Hsp70 and Hsp90 chaperone [Boletus edulis BED1]|uniref:Activator of Hsp70 and Hsp90 chaperone n=1 Tax=Boletus edulis BED1 TaxID=1328754 RepID=A0AAD4C7V1_BOLED|nr:activator of Hsp70 and Hsp90 chaperone [Boletus edulis BED1]
MADANALKDQGNKAFVAKDYDKAIELFTAAIAIDPNNHVLYSNRSAANAGKRLWSAALEDAEKCVSISPSWGKGYARKGAALHGARRFEEAIAAYEEGIKSEDSPALRKGLQEVRDAQVNDAGGSDMGLARLFRDPNLIGKLAANPQTQKHLADPAFVQKLQMMQQNPQLADAALSLDPRMIDVLGVALNINMQGFSREEGSDELPPGLRKTSPPQSPRAQATPSSSTSNSKPTPPPKPEPEAEKMDVEMSEEDAEEAKAKADALAEKQKGTEFYKQRRFDEAAAAFSKAWDLWSKDITFLTNLGAVYFEQGEYDKCIETCEKAVEEGRSHRADFKLLAKAFGRVGAAYSQKGDFVSAKKYFQKSLAEHRDAGTLAKLQATEKAIAEAEHQAYVDPAKSATAREEGNAAFKAGQFADAVKLYTESIKRDPSDARGYNNRAAAYMKLLALAEALKDANEAIKVDPSFVKAHVRKASILHAMRDYSKALEALQVASSADTANAHTAEIQAQEMKTQQALFTQRAGETEEQTLERAMKDPEVAGIMSDPVMQQILQQAQSNPGALQDHMKNPIIREKIVKLVNAGIIKTR